MKNILKICFNLLNISLITTFLIVDLCASSKNKRKRENESDSDTVETLIYPRTRSDTQELLEIDPEAGKLDLFKTLPVEKKLEIMSHLSDMDRLNLGQCSRGLHELSRDITFTFERHIFRNFYDPESQEINVSLTAKNTDIFLEKLIYYTATNYSPKHNDLEFLLKEIYKKNRHNIKGIHISKPGLVQSNSSKINDSEKSIQSKEERIIPRFSFADFVMEKLRQFLLIEEFIPKVKNLKKLQRVLYKKCAHELNRKYDYFNDQLTLLNVTDWSFKNDDFDQSCEYFYNLKKDFDETKANLSKETSDRNYIESFLKTKDFREKDFKEIYLEGWYDNDLEWRQTSDKFKLLSEHYERILEKIETAKMSIKSTQKKSTGVLEKKSQLLPKKLFSDKTCEDEQVSTSNNDKQVSVSDNKELLSVENLKKTFNNLSEK